MRTAKFTIEVAISSDVELESDAISHISTEMLIPQTIEWFKKNSKYELKEGDICVDAFCNKDLIT
jgi:hypothetical protein